MTPDSIMEYFATVAYEDMLAFHKRFVDGLQFRARVEKKEPPVGAPAKRVRKPKAEQPALPGVVAP